MQAQASNLVDLLRERADRSPARTAFRFLADGETESESITYGQLDQRARGLAIRLRDIGAEGRPVLLMLPAGFDFIVSSWGSWESTGGNSTSADGFSCCSSASAGYQTSSG